MATPEKVTEEQAAEALRAIVQQSHNDADDTETVIETKPEEAPAPEPEPETPATESAEAAPVETAPAPSESDDVASLKQRLQEREDQIKKAESLHEARWKAIQERSAANERILRDRYLKKASVADRALKTLQATRTEQGVPEADVDRVIRELQSTMHPDSANYAPPVEVQPVAQEDQSIALNRFLNEKGMTSEEEAEFGKWIRAEAPTALSQGEQDIARESLGGFLHLAHKRWQDGLREKANQRSEAVAAVKVVQRTQREAAKAAAPATSAPRKQPTAPKAGQIDWKKMTKAEEREMVAALLKQSVEQYR